MNLKEMCSQVNDLAIETGEFIRNQKNRITSEVIETKGVHNFVTYVDTTAEKQLVEGLKNILPEAGFIAEEETNKEKGAVYNWIIDPLDGTTNYIHGLSPYAISIALMENTEIILGVIYEVSLDECFYAWKGGRAYLNGKEIQVSKIKTVDGSLIATGFPYYNYDRLKPYMQTIEHFVQHSHGMRRLGSAATDMAYVACGRFEAFYEYGLSPWDVAAGVIIVQRAGGKVCDFYGGNNYIFGRELIATNNHIFDEFVKVIQGYMK